MDVEMSDGPLGSSVGPQGHTLGQPQTVTPSMLVNGQMQNAAASSGSELPSMAGGNESSLHMGNVEVIDITSTDSEGEASTTSESDTEIITAHKLNGTKASRARARLLSVLSRRTGVCYDPRMRSHYNLVDNDDHPEDPRRVRDIFNALVQGGLLHDANSPGPHPEDLLRRILARKATIEEICLVHSVSHFDFIRRTRDASHETLLDLSKDGDSVYYNSNTYTAARIAAGAAIECCKAVVTGEVKNAIAVIRPPGHHAVPGEAQGFCIFNNVSVAARVCQKAFGDKCRKILIFDWDVHHGNGTQDTFYKDPNILYMSIHVYGNGTFYPALVGADHKHCGGGRGVGKNVNVPWSEQGMGNPEYIYAFQKVILPIASEFNPDLILVSAGFDAAEGDDIGGCFVTPACYAQMIYGLMGLAKGKVVVCLEGGYNLRSLSKCALAVTKTLMGEAPERLELNSISKRAIDDVHRVMRRQSRYWQCMSGKRNEDLSDSEGERFERLHDMVQAYRARTLYETHDMAGLLVVHEQLPQPARNQVLVTRNWRNKDVLLVILHDPPGLEGSPDPESNMMEAHETWLVDPIKNYIGGACTKGWAVMDVNIPKFITDPDEWAKVKEYDNWRIRYAQKILVYLWDNYIVLSEVRKVVFLGVRDAHQGIMHLLNSRDCSSKLRGVVHVINDAALRAVKHEADSDFKSWYHKNSLIYVNKEHDIWVKNDPLKKRFGQLKLSPKTEITPMLEYHKVEIMEWIEKRLEE